METERASSSAVAEYSHRGSKALATVSPATIGGSKVSGLSSCDRDIASAGFSGWDPDRLGLESPRWTFDENYEMGCGGLTDSQQADERVNESTAIGFTDSTESCGAEPARGLKLQVAVRLKPRRRRPKQELEQLRRIVAQLTETRDQLRRQARCKMDSHRLSKKGSALLWEKTAGEQDLHRKRAENTNRQLRKLLQTQRRKASYLERTLHTGPKSASEMPDWCSSTDEEGATPADNDAVFEDLANELDGMYLQVAQTRTTSKPFPVAWEKSRVRSGVVFTDQDRKIVPFDRRVVETAVWDSMGERGVRDGNNSSVSCSEGTNNTRNSSWHATYRRKSLDVDVLLRKVARKFVADDQTVVVCRTLMEPTSLGNFTLSGFQYWENRYVVIERGMLAGSAPATTIDTFLEVFRHTQRGEQSEQYPARYVGMLSEYEIIAWQNLIAARAQTLENLMMDAASSRRSIGGGDAA